MIDKKSFKKYNLLIKGAIVKVTICSYERRNVK